MSPHLRKGLLGMLLGVVSVVVGLGVILLRQVALREGSSLLAVSLLIGEFALATAAVVFFIYEAYYLFLWVKEEIRKELNKE